MKASADLRSVNKEQLYQALDDQTVLGQLTLPELNGIVAEYPFFEMGWMLLLKNLKQTDDIQFQSKLRLASVHISNRARLFELMNEPAVPSQTGEQPSATEPPTDEKSKIDRALEAINKLNGPTSGYTLPDKPVSLGKDGKLTFDDWVRYYDNKPASETEDARQRHQKDMIDAFLVQEDSYARMPQSDASVEVQNVDIQEESEHDNDDIFSETLASIYIKQKQYSKAINIFRKLSLKNPEKSIYFAARISELEKQNDKT